jgi:hypothetical protein
MTKEMLFFALPLIGKLLKALPFVSNKLIPFVLAALATAKNYWILLGFPVAADATTAALGGDLQLAGVLGALGNLGVHLFAIGGGLVESWLSQQVYRSAKYKTAWDQASKKGMVSESAVKPHWLV